MSVPPTIERNRVWSTADITCSSLFWWDVVKIEVGRYEDSPGKQCRRNRYECEPGLVEVVRQFPCHETDPGAEEHDEDVVGQRNDEPDDRFATVQLHVLLENTRHSQGSCRWIRILRHHN